MEIGGAATEKEEEGGEKERGGRQVKDKIRGRSRRAQNGNLGKQVARDKRRCRRTKQKEALCATKYRLRRKSKEKKAKQGG